MIFVYLADIGIWSLIWPCPGGNSGCEHHPNGGTGLCRVVLLDHRDVVVFMSGIFLYDMRSPTSETSFVLTLIGVRLSLVIVNITFPKHRHTVCGELCQTTQCWSMVGKFAIGLMLHDIGIQGWCTDVVLAPIGIVRHSPLTSAGFLLAGRWYMETILGWVQEEEPSSDSNAETPSDWKSVLEFARVKDGKGFN